MACIQFPKIDLNLGLVLSCHVFFLFSFLPTFLPSSLSFFPSPLSFILSQTTPCVTYDFPYSTNQAMKTHVIQLSTNKSQAELPEFQQRKHNKARYTTQPPAHVYLNSSSAGLQIHFYIFFIQVVNQNPTLKLRTCMGLFMDFGRQYWKLMWAK